MKSLLIVFGLFSAVFGQQLMSLNVFQGGNQQNFLPGIAPYSVYLSASSDDDNLLKSVSLVSGGNTISFFDLKNRREFANNITQIQQFPVTQSAYVTSSLTTDQMRTLTGMLYISSTRQMQDAGFYVLDTANTQNIYSVLNPQNVTILFLNTNSAMTPPLSTTFSNWTQISEDMYLYQGIPVDSDAYESDFSQIFSNPVKTPQGWDRYDNVEKFSVQLTAFYMKAFAYSPLNLINFKIEQGYVDIQNTYTTDMSTTGFYMKRYGDPDCNITVKSRSNDDYRGYIGGNILGSVPAGANVTFSVEAYKNTVNPTNLFTPWTAPVTGGLIGITSQGAQNGQFYVQYYVNQYLPTTQPPSTTTQAPVNPGASTSTKIPETTTKSTATLFSMISLIMIVLVAY